MHLVKTRVKLIVFAIKLSTREQSNAESCMHIHYLYYNTTVRVTYLIKNSMNDRYERATVNGGNGKWKGKAES